MTLRPTGPLQAAPADTNTQSAGPQAASPPTARVPLPGSMGLRARLVGVVRAPKRTYAALVAAPRSLDVLALTFVVSAFRSAVLLQTEVGRLALLDQWERTAIAFGQPVDDAQYAALDEASRNGLAYAVATSLASGPVLAIGLAAVLFAVFSGVLRGGGTFGQVLAIAAHAQVILALRQVIVAPVNYARETLANPTTMVLFFGMFDEASPVARFMGMIDLFVIWWIAILAVGISVLYRRPFRQLLFTFLGAYLALALLLALVMAATGGTA